MFAEDLDSGSERNALKIEITRYAVYRRRRSPITQVLVNIPSRHIESGAAASKLGDILDLACQKSGLVLPVHRPSLAVEATFLLEDRRTSALRTFTGSVQEINRQKNIIIDYTTVSSYSDVRRILHTASDPNFISEKLDNAAHFPDSVWRFAGLVSLVLNLQTSGHIRATGGAERPPYQKLFPRAILD